MNNRLVWGIGLKLLATYLKQKQTEGQPKISISKMSEKDQALLDVKNKLGAVIVILGTRGTGKTELAYRMAQFIGKPTYAVSPEQKPHPTFIQQINLENLNELVPPNSTVILDDAPVYLSSRDYHEHLVREVEKIIPLVRHERKLHLIVVSQSGSFIDKWALDAEAVLLKPQSILSADIERPGIRRLYQGADECFSGHDLNWVRRHAFLVTPTWKGIIEVAMVHD